MQVTSKQNSDTNITLTISAAEAYLSPVKTRVLERLKDRVKLAGFREGKVPLNLVEKNIDPTTLQSEFLDEALNEFYGKAIAEQKLRPVDRPEVNIKKFVPFTELEFEATLEILGPIKLVDYKKFKKAKPTVTVVDADIQEVLDSIKTRMAEKKDVQRAAKAGDEAWIDFKGVDAKKEPIKGADGKDYPLLLGSNSFIPGFEDNVIGMELGAKKTFTLTFPKDYQVKALANKKVTFTVTLTKVQELTEPKLDDAFAKKVGPFKNMDELKSDIKKQVILERQNQADREFENELINELATKSKMSIPQSLIDEQAEQLLRDLRQNLSYRGQTYPEYLEAEGKTEEEYRMQVINPDAERRVRAGLALAEVAEVEGLNVTPDELEIRMQLLRAQYKDEQMQSELDKPEAQRDIASRILTEKTIAKLVGYATK